METPTTEMKGILFVGLCCLDIVNVCNEYPKEDSDQRVLSQGWYRGGNAANNCTVFAKLREWFENEQNNQCHVFAEYFGSFGNDYSAKFLLDDFLKYNICVKKVDTNSETPCSCIVINKENGSRTILHSNKNFKEPTVDSFKKLNLSNYCWIHFEGRNVDQVQLMIKHIRQMDKDKMIGISVELEKPIDSLKQFIINEDIDYLFIGKDFALFSGYNNIDHTIIGLLNKVSMNTTVICLWGEYGVKASKKCSENNVIHSSNIFQPKTGLINTLGAGDSCISAILFAVIVLSYDLCESIKFGCQVAGAKCGNDGFDHLHQFHVFI